MYEESIILNGRYELLERIGSGGMAIVYKATDHALGRVVAIKLMHQSLTNDSNFLRRFQQEAHAAANLTHPRIVTVHDIGQDGSRHYIVMEYVDGQTLKDIIRSYNADDRLLPINRTLALTQQVCEGIGYAHRSQIVHCDIKPQNILVTRDDRVKVADFGIARALSQINTQEDDGMVWGTPQYFAPEQAAGEPTTPASDVYSIGIVLFETLTGVLPFTGENGAEIAMKHLQESPPMVNEYNAAVPLDLSQIVNKLLSKEPAARYRTAGQLTRILHSYQQSHSHSVVTPVRQPTANAVAPMVVASPTAVSPTIVAPAISLDADTRPTPAINPETAAMGDENDITDVDPTAIALGIIALIALLGLIPLWFVVYQAWSQ